MNFERECQSIQSKIQRIVKDKNFTKESKIKLNFTLRSASRNNERPLLEDLDHLENS